MMYNKEMENKNFRSGGLRFEEDQTVGSHRPSHMVGKGQPILRLIMKLSGGLIKNKKQANKVALAIIIIAVAASLLVIVQNKSNTEELPNYLGESETV